MANKNWLKRLGIGLVIVGLTAWFIFTFRLHPGAQPFGLMILGGWLLPIIGLGCYARAKERSAFWAAMGVLPILGPILALVAIGIDDGLAKRAAPRWLRRIVKVGFALAAPALLLAIAIPNFLRFSQRSPQSEARMVLTSIYVAQKAFYAEHGRYGTFKEIGFEPAITNARYTFRIDRTGAPGTVYHAKVRPPTLDNMGVHAGISADGQRFTATASANLDADATIDRWHIHDSRRKPVHDTDDSTS